MPPNQDLITARQKYGIAPQGYTKPNPLLGALKSAWGDVKQGAHIANDAAKMLTAEGLPGITSDKPIPSTWKDALHAGVSDRKENVESQFAFDPKKPEEGFSKTLSGFAGMAAPEKEIATQAPKVFEGFSDLSTKLLERLKGKSTVSKEHILNETNRPDLKQTERDLIRSHLEDEGNEVNVPSFAEKVRAEILPLSRTKTTMRRGLDSTGGRYESVTLPNDIRGPVADYSEHVYESPVKTSAGDVHFSHLDTGNYFGHTRVEDLPDVSNVGYDYPRLAEIEQAIAKGEPYSKSDYAALKAMKEKGALGIGDKVNQGGTRRVIEVQSDLFQKGRLENEFGAKGVLPKGRSSVGPEEEAYNASARSALEPYKNNAAHFRMIREEVKQAATDGKTKLQFPTGETAMKIEGLGQNTSNWVGYGVRSGGGYSTSFELLPDRLKVGMRINQGDNPGADWIITDVLGDGKFKAVPKRVWDDAKKFGKKNGISNGMGAPRHFDTYVEQFDISGKVDTENPIYKFYEKEVGRYLKNKYNAKLITDPQGVKWWELNVDEEKKKLPVEAFGILPFLLGGSAINNDDLD